jgi:hypothetical protein
MGTIHVDIVDAINFELGALNDQIYQSWMAFF